MQRTEIEALEQYFLSQVTDHCPPVDTDSHGEALYFIYYVQCRRTSLLVLGNGVGWIVVLWEKLDLLFGPWLSERAKLISGIGSPAAHGAQPIGACGSSNLSSHKENFFFFAQASVFSQREIWLHSLP